MDLPNIISQTLTTLSEDTVKVVSAKLLECGVETNDDLQYIEEGDLCGILKPIQLRKLLSAWKHDGELCIFLLLALIYSNGKKNVCLQAIFLTESDRKTKPKTKKEQLSYRK